MLNYNQAITEFDAGSLGIHGCLQQGPLHLGNLANEQAACSEAWLKRDRFRNLCRWQGRCVQSNTQGQRDKDQRVLHAPAANDGEAPLPDIILQTGNQCVYRQAHTTKQCRPARSFGTCDEDDFKLRSGLSFRYLQPALLQMDGKTEFPQSEIAFARCMLIKFTFASPREHCAGVTHIGNN